MIQSTLDRIRRINDLKKAIKAKEDELYEVQSLKEYERVKAEILDLTISMKVQAEMLIIGLDAAIETI